MGLDLRKGQKADVTKGRPNLRQIIVGMGWQESGVEIDVAAFLLDGREKTATEEDFVFYGNPQHSSGSVKHLGANESEDAAQVKIDFAAVPQHVERIAFTATIYEAESRRQDFSQVHGLYLRIVDIMDGQELLRYPLEDAFTVETAIVVGAVYRHKGEWKFHAVGSGFSGGLAALCGNFGIEVAEEGQSTPPVAETKAVAPQPSSAVSAQTAAPTPPPPATTPPQTPQTQTPVPGPMPTQQPTPSMMTAPAASAGGQQSAPLNLSRGAAAQIPPASQPRPMSLSGGMTQGAAAMGSVPIVQELMRGQRVQLVSGPIAGNMPLRLTWKGAGGTMDRGMALGCLYELADGSKGAIQPVGNRFGNLQQPPFIALGSSNSVGGSQNPMETLWLNGAMTANLRRILVFAFFYGGTDWQQAGAQLSLQPPEGQGYVMRLDESSPYGLCAVALLSQQGGMLSAEKVLQFFPGMQAMDQTFQWGLRWVSNR